MSESEVIEKPESEKVEKPESEEVDKPESEEVEKQQVLKPGVAHIKQEFLLKDYKPQIVTEFLPDSLKEKLQANESTGDAENNDESSEPPVKKIKLKGRNKRRPFEKKPDDADKLCPSIRMERECTFAGRCRFSHDIKAFCEGKPEDLGKTCYMFETFGKCPYGLTCRYGSQHISEDYKNVVNKELWEKKSKDFESMNLLPKDLQKLLWKKKYDFTKANKICSQVLNLLEKRRRDEEKNQKSNKTNTENVNSGENSDRDADGMASLSSETSEAESNNEIPKTTISTEDASMTSGCVTDEDLIKLKPKEIKLIDFSNKLYLAPLTTVGNLPFRRICKEYGADITCGEMALSTNLLQGQQSEWALLKRHPSEDLFGVQICGGFPDTMTRCGQLLQETINVDFIDINCGCPIDMIYKKGEGCALMARSGKFEQVVRSMISVLDIPLTVKMRTGVFSSKSIAHNLTPKLRNWGVSMVTVHGRSREQRYTRLADWDYIQRCCQSGKPMPFFGNGDVLSYEDYNNYREKSGVDGIMIARGALIKPQIFIGEL
ncbi:tRNA-dihydrouridine(47) synthase [NAD(P)(+)]-like [Patella vulgata]|uniref:tRNA-dihydrouridine(47) synthase [NAD(P)(+)]-like n=1 Tax=Patella vulgata TaxID=6465 RepID=UPI0024A84270|nr:tRNA-dihydrouridine(47) synthase [NAD(P)(+)]-like [Patella vulgata]